MTKDVFARQLAVAFERDYPGLRKGSSFGPDGPEAEGTATDSINGTAARPSNRHRSFVAGPIEPNGDSHGIALRRLIEDLHDLTYQVTSPALAQKVNDLVTLVDMEVHFLSSADHD